MTDHAPGLEALFAASFPEGRFPLTPWGAPPPFEGIFVQNGPARFAWNDRRYRHWLDGDGMVQLVDLRGSPSVTCRYVRTPKWQEQEKGKTFRAFGTRFPDDELLFGRMLANPANVHAQWVHGELLAFGEQGLPFRLGPELQTEEETTFGRALSRLSPFAAHAKVNEAGWANFGVDYHPLHPCLYTYEFNRRHELVRSRRVPLPKPYCIHDFVLHPRYFVFHLSGYTLDLQAILRGATVLEALQWNAGEASELWFVAREGDEVRRIEAGPGYCLHLVNGFSRGATEVVDVLLYERPLYDQFLPLPQTYPDVQKGEVTRFEVEGSRLKGRSTLPYTRLPDFPHHAPGDRGKAYARFWGVGCAQAEERGRKFFNEIVGWNWEREAVLTHTLDGYVGGEPLYVEDARREPWIVCQMAYPQKGYTRYGFFRPDRISDGPVGGWQSPHLLPLGLHGGTFPQ